MPHVAFRTPYTRQSANLWEVKPLTHHMIATELGEIPDNRPSVNGFSMPAGHLAQFNSSRLRREDAIYGFCASNNE